ncbi:MAG: hypothetical protein IPO92_16915 [Saprospiraceae bacterium]|nr:hypothetical protein [Saprospiraceae bacterium]
MLYAFSLEKKSIKIRHIDNAVIHDGLETAHIFIKKTENAVTNLALLFQQKKIPPTRLIRKYIFLEEYGLISSFEWMYKKMENNIKKNMLSASPSIALFNLWKLYLFINLLHKK